MVAEQPASCVNLHIYAAAQSPFEVAPGHVALVNVHDPVTAKFLPSQNHPPRRLESVTEVQLG